MGVGMLTAGIILALMILPYISAVMRDVSTMTPAVVEGIRLRHGRDDLGGDAQDDDAATALRARRRLFLGLGRAIGETMAVTFVIGNDHKISASLFAAGNTIASTLANEFTEAAEPLYCVRSSNSG